MVALLGVSACLPAHAQAASPSVPAKVKKVTISGRITSDGAAIVAGKVWSIENAEMLRAHVGEYVTVRGSLDSVTRKVEVWSFRPVPQVSNSARLGDSAFRR